MRYERLSDIARLAIRLQGLRGGMTIADIQQEFDVSRRTAERLCDAVENAFGPLDTVPGPLREAINDRRAVVLTTSDQSSKKS